MVEEENQLPPEISSLASTNAPWQMHVCHTKQINKYNENHPGDICLYISS